MVLGEAAPSEHLAAPAPGLDPGARGVHEHDVERGEQIAPAGEQLLLQNVLHAARRKRRRAVLLVFRQLLAQPRHRAIKMMQLDPADAVDAVVLAPAVGGAVRAATDETVQHGQERRAPQREVMAARSRQALDQGLWPPLSMAPRYFLKSGAAKFPSLAGWRSAVGVIGASVFWRPAATLQGRRNGSWRGRSA